MFVTYDVDLQLKQIFFQLQYIALIIHNYSYNTFNIELNTSATCVHNPKVHRFDEGSFEGTPLIFTDYPICTRSVQYIFRKHELFSPNLQTIEHRFTDLIISDL